MGGKKMERGGYSAMFQNGYLCLEILDLVSELVGESVMQSRDVFFKECMGESCGSDWLS
jgi:hypothetical protein